MCFMSKNIVLIILEFIDFPISCPNLNLTAPTGIIWYPNEMSLPHAGYQKVLLPTLPLTLSFCHQVRWRTKVVFYFYKQRFHNFGIYLFFDKLSQFEFDCTYWDYLISKWNGSAARRVGKSVCVSVDTGARRISPNKMADESCVLCLKTSFS